ncbi:MAG: ABC transporter permease [Nocardioidaceae bacterium]
MSAAAEDIAAPDDQGRGGPLVRELRFVLRHSRSVQIGLTIVIVLLLIGAFAPVLTGYSPYNVDLSNTLQPPSRAHLLGTDELGRDELTRLFYAARVSMVVGLAAVAISNVLGVLFGLLAGYAGGVTDNLIMRAMDGILAFPALLLALLVISVLGPGLFKILIAFGIAFAPSNARLLRSMVVSVRENEYVAAARALGASRIRVMVRYVLPNSISPLIVSASLGMGFVIIGLAGLGYLGLGAQPPTAEWGAMLSGSQARFFTAPWLLLAPGGMILAAVVGYVLLGDGLRDALDPRLRQSQG